jgi:hypothetical protein
MAVAVLYNFRIGLGLASHPFELAILFVSLTLTGPGSLTISRVVRSGHLHALSEAGISAAPPNQPMKLTVAYGARSLSAKR